MLLSTLVIAPAMVLATPLSFRVRYGLAQIWVRYNLWSLGAICKLRHEVEGLENLPTVPSVVLAKHQSAWETIAVQVIFPPVAFILKRELLQIPFWGWAMRTQEPIAIDRSARTAALKQVLKDGEARLNAGRWVVIFPEGTRMPPGERGRYNASGGLLACRAGCPVVPMAHNAGTYWRRNAFLKFPGVIKVRIGPPIDASQVSAAEVNRLAEDWIEQAMKELALS